MRINKFLTLSCLFGMLASPVFSQVNEVVDAGKVVVPVKESDQERMERVAKAYANTKERNRKVATAAVTDPTLQRAREMQQRHAEYLKKLESGEVRRFPHLVEKWDEYQDQAKEIQALYEEFKNEADTGKKNALAPVILEKVQPVGRFFKSASHGDRVAPKLTQAQVDEELRLMREYNNAPSTADEEEGALELVTPNIFFTFKHLPMPIEFSAPQGTKVYLASTQGGEFMNGMDYVTIEADENNVARTWWVSHGDGVAGCHVEFRSDQYPSVGNIEVYVKSPFLIDLNTLSPIIEKAAKTTSKAVEPQLKK